MSAIPALGELEEGELEIQRRRWFCKEFKASLGYIEFGLKAK